MKLNQLEQEELSYNQLAHAYANGCFTYKSNKIMKKFAQPGTLYKYPQRLLLSVSKFFHLNQFELIFFSQILTEEEPCHDLQPDIFFRASRRLDSVEMEERGLYLYLLVIGYGVKYYLNQSVGVYEQQIKKKVPEFTNVFQAWAKKYSTRVLRINPKKLNTFYVDLMKSEDKDDANFKNYNEIVEDLGHIGPAEYSDDQNMDMVVDLNRNSEHNRDVSHDHLEESNRQ